MFGGGGLGGKTAKRNEISHQTTGFGPNTPLADINGAVGGGYYLNISNSRASGVPVLRELNPIGKWNSHVAAIRKKDCLSAKRTSSQSPREQYLAFKKSTSEKNPLPIPTVKKGITSGRKSGRTGGMYSE